MIVVITIFTFDCDLSTAGCLSSVVFSQTGINSIIFW